MTAPWRRAEGVRVLTMELGPCARISGPSAKERCHLRSSPAAGPVNIAGEQRSRAPSGGVDKDCPGAATGGGMKGGQVPAASAVRAPAPQLKGAFRRCRDLGLGGRSDCRCPTPGRQAERVRSSINAGCCPEPGTPQRLAQIWRRSSPPDVIRRQNKATSRTCPASPPPVPPCLLAGHGSSSATSRRMNSCSVPSASGPAGRGTAAHAGPRSSSLSAARAVRRSCR